MPLSASALCSTKTEVEVGLEVVPFTQRRIFISPPLMFCFKGCPVSISCGQCNQLVKQTIPPANKNNPTTNSNSNWSNQNLLEQLSDHYRFSFWISDSAHVKFFENSVLLNRQACCIVCQRTFASIVAVLRHVREILLDPNMRTRKFHWLVLENITNLFVNRDIGYIKCDSDLAYLIAELFPQDADLSLFEGRPNFDRIFENLRSIMEVPSLSDCEHVDSNNNRSVTSEASDGECEMLIVDGGDGISGGQVVTFTSDVEVCSVVEEEDLLSQVADTMRNESEAGEETDGGGMDCDSDVVVSSDSECDDIVREEMEVTWVTHTQRVTRWVSMRPMPTDAQFVTPTPTHCEQAPLAVHLDAFSPDVDEDDDEKSERIHTPRAVRGITRVRNGTKRNMILFDDKDSLSEYCNTNTSSRSDSQLSTFFEELDLSSATCMLQSVNTTKSAMTEYRTGSAVSQSDTDFITDESSQSDLSFKVIYEKESPKRGGVRITSNFKIESTPLDADFVVHNGDPPSTSHAAVKNKGDSIKVAVKPKGGKGDPSI